MDSFLRTFRVHNIERASTCFHHDTSEVWWTNAIAGEAGEACNISKKISRGDFRNAVAEAGARKMLAYELADVITYCDLLLAKLDYSLEEILLAKFNLVSERVGYPHKLAA